MDLPSGDVTLMLAGLSTADFTLADVSSTIILMAADYVLKDITKVVSFEALTKRTGDATDTKYVLKHRYISDSEFSSFDLTVGIDDVFVFDSEDFDDVSGSTLTIDSIDAFNGFVTLNTAQSSTVYVSYRWAPVPIQGGITDQAVKNAVAFKACEIMWDAIIGGMTSNAVEDYRVTMVNKFREKYAEVVRKINAKGQFRVVKRKVKMRQP